MIGYYVHHHGSGHLHRFLAVAARRPQVVALSSAARPAEARPEAWIPLAHDATSEQPVDETAGGALHWAPLNEAGLRRRTAQLARWADRHDPRALVVDVSVEIALTARLLSVPTVVVAQHGDRSDSPHTLAYRTAGAVAALWPQGAAADPIGEVHHVGPISRFDDWDAPILSPRQAPGDGGSVLVLCGRGGLDFTAADLIEAAAACGDGWTWRVIGIPAPVNTGPACISWEASADANEIWTALHEADVVVAPASNNCVAEVAAAGRPLVALPQRRPFDEQHAHAGVLAELGLAHVYDVWPPAAMWPALLERAAASTPDWAGYHDRRGAERLAALAEAVGGA